VKALILTDLQNDFLPGGALGIEGADEILPIIERLIHRFEHVIAVQDWHPPHHISFKEWPPHCLQGSRGAELSAQLPKEKIEAVFHKGSDLNVDSYSAFFDNERKRQTGLAEYLKKKKITELYFVGLATDYCVLYSVRDALELGFKVWVIEDACKAIHDQKKPIIEMKERGANIVRSETFY
jgi:nicotinamidase/pyrazinamidase